MIRELGSLRRREIRGEGRQAELVEVRPTLGILEDPRPHVLVEHEEIDGLPEDRVLARPAWAGRTLRRAFQIERRRGAVIDIRPELVRLIVKSVKVKSSVEIAGQDECNAPTGQIVDCLLEFIDVTGEDAASLAYVVRESSAPLSVTRPGGALVHGPKTTVPGWTI